MTTITTTTTRLALITIIMTTIWMLLTVMTGIAIRTSCPPLNRWTAGRRPDHWLPGCGQRWPQLWHQTVDHYYRGGHYRWEAAGAPTAPTPVRHRYEWQYSYEWKCWDICEKRVNRQYMRFSLLLIIIFIMI